MILTYWHWHIDIDIMMLMIWIYWYINIWIHRKYKFFIRNMSIFDIQTIKILIFHWFSVYYVHSETASETAGWAWLGCLGGLGGRGSPRASEEQKTLKNLAKMARQFPGLCFPILFGPHERQIHIFGRETRPALRQTPSETTTYISFPRQDP